MVFHRLYFVDCIHRDAFLKFHNTFTKLEVVLFFNLFLQYHSL